MNKTIPIIIVEFNTAIRTIEYIKEFIEKVQVKENISFIVVDNGVNSNNYIELIDSIKIHFSVNDENKLESTDKRVSKCIKYDVDYNKLDFSIISVKAKDNYGFAIGNNIGTIIAQEIFQIEYIIYSNSDIQIENPFNLQKMIDILKEDKDIALVGPNIKGLDNIPQTPCKERNLWQRWGWLSIVWPLNRILKNSIFETSADTIYTDDSCYAYRLIGAFMMFDFNKFLEINMFDENTFLYGEELIIGAKLKKLGYKTYYCHSEKLIHEQGGSTKKNFSNVQSLVNKFNSEMYYYKNYKDMNNLEYTIIKVLFVIYKIKYWVYCSLKKIINK